jgi:hypothetical protein
VIRHIDFLGEKSMSNERRSGVGEFGDLRRAERGAWIFERIVATGCLVCRQIGGDRAGEVAVHRFLSAPEVTRAEIIETLGRRTGEQCRGLRIVVAQDTTEINFRGRDRGRRGLGPGGDGNGLGFFIHSAVAIDADTEDMVGLLDAAIWTRPCEGEPAPRRQRPLEEKESYRWLATAQTAAQRVSGARQLIVVGDRDSDIYPLFARRPASVEMVVRAAQDRALEDGGRLFAQAAGWPILGSYEVKIVPRRPGEQARIARVSLRAGAIRVKHPRNGVDRDDPPVLNLTLVEAREEAAPPSVEPLHWRLITTLPATERAAAQDIVRLYRLRWRSEQTHRAVKNDGFALPDVQLHDADRLMKLAALAIGAAVRTIQLVDARDGSTRPASDVVDADTLEAAEAIAPTLEGKTPRQKNPHPPRSLAWLAWIMARLGGWNCYYKPPGPKTMRAGWDRFAAMAAGFAVAKVQMHRSIAAAHEA